MDPLALLVALFPEFGPYLAYVVASAAFASMFMPAPIRSAGFYAKVHRIVNALGANLRHAKNAGIPRDLNAAAATLGLGPVGSGIPRGRGLYPLRTEQTRGVYRPTAGAFNAPQIVTGARARSSVVPPPQGSAVAAGVAGAALGLAFAHISRDDAPASAVSPEPESPQPDPPGPAASDPEG